MLTFVRNRGELAEGWYEPATLQKAKASAASLDYDTRPQKRGRTSSVYSPKEGDGGTSEEDELGPSLPREPVQSFRRGQRSGPVIPNTQDLEMQR
ncbi:MAG: hypothetical protein Q9164_007422, partial [Protoblastenia rupestris]